MDYNDIIYFDNAATTRTKPSEVYESFDYYVRNIGTSPGRGSHLLAIEASRCLYQARKVITDYFGCPSTNNLVLTKNATEAFNLFLRGFLNKGDHVLISPFDHNAVFRPLHKLKLENRIDYTILPKEAFVEGNEDVFDSYIQGNTRLVIMPLGSNITGEILYSPIITKYFSDNGIKVLLDTAQGAGRVRVDMKNKNIDFLVFTGHKDLYGLPGTGGLCALNPLDIQPLIQGGTGVHADTFINPDIIPEKYEAGTMNMPSIWSLKAGIEYIEKNRDEVLKKENKLYSVLNKELTEIDDVILYNNLPDNSLPIVSFNIKGKDCQEVAYHLSQNNICVRAGLHCNILAHTCLGTSTLGVVRASLDFFNKEWEVEKFVHIIRKIIEG